MIKEDLESDNGLTDFDAPEGMTKEEFLKQRKEKESKEKTIVKPTKRRRRTRQPKVELPDVKIPLAKFLMSLSGKWKAEEDEAKFIEDSFDYWCKYRASVLIKVAPEIYVLLGVGNYLSKRVTIFKKKSQKKNKGDDTKENT